MAGGLDGWIGVPVCAAAVLHCAACSAALLPSWLLHGTCNEHPQGAIVAGALQQLPVLACPPLPSRMPKHSHCPYTTALSPSPPPPHHPHRKAEKEAKKKAEAEAAEAAAAAEKAAQLSLLEGSDKVETAAAVEALRSLLPTMEPATLAGLMKRMNVEGGLVGKMRALFEALFAGQKALLPGAIKTRAPLLKAAAKDAPSQLAMLVALEWLVTVCEPDRMKEVRRAGWLYVNMWACVLVGLVGLCDDAGMWWHVVACVAQGEGHRCSKGVQHLQPCSPGSRRCSIGMQPLLCSPSSPLAMYAPLP